MLILRQLVVVVRDLKPIPRHEYVQMESIFAVGLVVQAIEDRLIVPDIVNWGVLRRIQKAPAAKTVDGDEVPEFRVAVAEARAAAGTPKRAIVSIDVPKYLAGAQARTSGD